MFIVNFSIIKDNKPTKREGHTYMLQTLQKGITDDYSIFVKKFYSLTEINLDLYKRGQMERRLRTMINQQKYHDFLSYYKALSENPTMLEEFIDKMTINVTEFFRNPERWELLKPVLKDLASKTTSLKVWSSACSTGQEPYTLSMILQETIKKPFSITATDIDKSVLEIAKNGVYSPLHMKSIPEPYKHKYFTSANDSWMVNEKTKRPVMFKRFNLLKDTYPSGQDLIVCRNVMIYFTEEAKDEMFHKFAKALKPGGILFVGATEQITNSKQYGFENLGSFFYQKI